ncbi:MAG TPA: hypothetical protein O0X64_01805, partial [Methanocorpusculum sp.]|nr:hypothetical protein [Methanocorpusculum sp.]
TIHENSLDILQKYQHKYLVSEKQHKMEGSCRKERRKTRRNRRNTYEDISLMLMEQCTRKS